MEAADADEQWELPAGCEAAALADWVDGAERAFSCLRDAIRAQEYLSAPCRLLTRQQIAAGLCLLSEAQ